MEEVKLKLKSKKLESGKFQVDFATEGCSDNYYGYLLAESKTSVREIVEKIRHHLGAAQITDRYVQPVLFSLGKRPVNSDTIMIFKR